MSAGPLPGDRLLTPAAPAAGERTARQGAPTFRMFVSSTFDDFEAERDVLRREVWPGLRALCAEYGARFHAIDLRWGVSEEAAADQQTMNICLGEIERCQRTGTRPSFLVLLGNHYGWRPPPPQIPGAEYQQVASCLAVDDRALIEDWYERDDNAVPAEYRLRRRTGGYLDPDRWKVVEARLTTALGAAVQQLGLPEPRRRCYLASATEQEISAGALEAGDPGQAVCFVREITGHPPVASADENDPVRAFVDEAQGALSALKDTVRLKLGEDWVVQRQVGWSTSGPAYDEDYLRGFAEDVGEALARPIRDELERRGTARDRAARGDGAELDVEIGAHDRFAAERRRFFTGRAGELARIDDYLDGARRVPLAVHGAGGTGKSAIIAEALRRAAGRPGGATLVARFIGATPGSSDIRALLAGMCQQLARHAGEAPVHPRRHRRLADEVPSDYASLIPDFARRLKRAAATGPVFVFIDSLDQLTDTGDSTGSLAWIPQPLPARVRMVVSTRPGDSLNPLRARGADLLKLPGLPAADGEELLDRWLDDAHRRLQDPQRRAVLTAFGDSDGNPLYLRLAFEQARRWASGDGQPPGQLAAGVRDLIRGNLLARLASEDNHGELLVSRALGYLAASRHGLAEDELMDLLSRDLVLYRSFLLDAYHLPGDLLDSARHYPHRPAGQEPDAWLSSVLEAARILDDQPWRIHRLLHAGYGRTVTELAEQAGVHPARAQRILTRLASRGLAAADVEGRWTAKEPEKATGTAGESLELAWARAYRSAGASSGTRWPFSELDPAGPVVGAGDDAAALDWLRRLGEWRDDLEAFLGAVIPARVPAAGDGGRRLAVRPRSGPGLPVVLWSRLSFDLAAYLTQRRAEGGDLLGFYHRELQDVAAGTYAAGEDGRALHSRLADYFQAQADPDGHRSWTTGDDRCDIRGLSELPYHLTRAQRWDDACQTLTDFRYLERKAANVGIIRAGAAGEPVLYTGVFQLQDDYDTVLRLMPGAAPRTTGRPRIIVTATDYGDGLTLRCPHCNTAHPFGRQCPACRTTHHLADWKGKDIDCPSEACHGPLTVNDFLVEGGRPDDAPAG